MNRAAREAMARQTVAILEEGSYALPDGAQVRFAQDLENCVEATRLLRPEEAKLLLGQVLAQPSAAAAVEVEIQNETTLAGIARLLCEGCAPVAALNFASAMNPGGGFLGGSQAQEESLARSSGLYASLMKAWDFYEQHRNGTSPLYSDAMILSPGCPIFRDDAGHLLSRVHHATFISGAAPNAGAVSNNAPHELSLLPETLRRRAEYVLALAASLNLRYIVLGAWGCGVFRNDPKLVARTFMELLARPDWRGRFSKVVFSVLDSSPKSELVETFSTAATGAGLPRAGIPGAIICPN